MIEQNEKTVSVNDYDRVATAIDKALTAFTGNAHEPPKNSSSNSITMTKDGFITGVIRFQRLRNYVEGLAKTHRLTETDPTPRGQNEPA